MDTQLVENLETLTAQQLLKWGLEVFHPRIAFASSFGAEDVVVIDMLAKLRADVRIFTLDTGRLHEETYEVMEQIRKRYGLRIETYFPDRDKVERLERTKGLYSFRESIENRKECCRIRKIEPLERALAPLDAWITGLRREQAVTRGTIARVEWNQPRPNLAKLNPLADWSEEKVWDYINSKEIPYNGLHDRGFPSIGCSPCTRAVAAGEDLRGGRWWWENPEQKECGLHTAEGGGNGNRGNGHGGDARGVRRPA